jgi:hypothetical protein
LSTQSRSAYRPSSRVDEIIPWAARRRRRGRRRRGAGAAVVPAMRQPLAQTASE